MVPIVHFEFWDERIRVLAAGDRNGLVANGLELRIIFAVETVTIFAHQQRREALAIPVR